jgi:outer membrane protein TolC
MANTFSLEECLEGAVAEHPLQPGKVLLNQMLTLQNQVIDKTALPELHWQGQARIQSESIGLDFDNPMIPSIEIPLYSAQTTLELRYNLYDGGFRKAGKQLNTANSRLRMEKTDQAIDQIKQQVLSNYLLVLFMQQKEKVLRASLDLIRENMQTLQAGVDLGVVDKTDLQQLIIREKELLSGLEANRLDIETGLQLLASLTGLPIDGQSRLATPMTDDFSIDGEVGPSITAVFDREREMLDTQTGTIEARSRPKVYTYLNAGTGYPNPLNFFDDELSLFAVGGIGFTWNFFDWGKARQEKQLIRVQQELVDNQEAHLLTSMNRLNDKYRLGIAKYEQLILDELEIIGLKKDIAAAQKTKLEKGVILPVEYLSNLNEIIRSELNLSSYELEIVKLRLEYQLFKGKI